MADEAWKATRSELLPLFEEFLQAQAQNKSGDASQDGRPDPARESESKNPSESAEALEKASKGLESKTQQNQGARDADGAGGEGSDGQRPESPGEQSAEAGAPKPPQASQAGSQPAEASPDASKPESSEAAQGAGKPSDAAPGAGKPSGASSKAGKPSGATPDAGKPSDAALSAGKPSSESSDAGKASDASSSADEPSAAAPDPGEPASAPPRASAPSDRREASGAPSRPSSGNGSSAKASTKPASYSQDELERVLAASADKLEQSRIRTLGDDSLLRSLVVEAAPLTDRLKKRVELALQRDDNVKWAGPFTSGSQLDLKAYIQDELRRSAGLSPKGRVFLRRQPDTEVSRAFEFSIGIDLSYSMGLTPAARDSDSAGWEKTLPLPGSAFFPMRLALVAMTEMFVHFEHPFAVSGFNSGAFVLKNLDEKPDEATRERVVRDLKLGPSSQDHRGLEVACGLLKKKSDARRIVFMLVDADRSELTKARVAQLEKEHDVTIIGVGIGDGCREVQRVYERYVLAPSIQDLPDLLGERLTQLIQG